MKRQFSKNTSRWPIHMKRCSTSLIIREIQIKTTLRYHLPPVRMAKINSGNDRCWQGCGERGTLLHCWWECKLVQLLWKTVWSFLKKLKMELPNGAAVNATGYFPKIYKTLVQRDTYTPMFIATLSTIAKLWEQPKCPSINKWIRKMWCVCVCLYTHTHICIYTQRTIIQP